MPSSKLQNRSGRRRPLGVVSANTSTSYLPPKYSASSVAKVNVGGGDYDDEVSVASSSASRFSYRGIKDKLSKKKQGLISSIRRGGGELSSASTAALDCRFEESGNAPCDALAYENFRTFIGRNVPTRESDEDNESPLKGKLMITTLEVVGESPLALEAALDRLLEDDANAPDDGSAYEDFKNFVHMDARPTREDDEDDESPPVKDESRVIAATLEDVDLRERAVNSPRVTCALLKSAISPSWSEYGSAMLEMWAVLEKDASFTDSPTHNVSNDSATDKITNTCGESHNFKNFKEDCVLDSVLKQNSTDGMNGHREVIFQSPSPLGEILNVDVDQERVPTSSAYYPPKDALSECLTYSGKSTSQVAHSLSIEAADRACEAIGLGKLKSLFDLENFDIDGLEFGASPVARSDSPQAPQKSDLKKTTYGSPGERSRMHTQRVKSWKTKKSRMLSSSVDERGRVLQRQPVEKELQNTRGQNQAIHKHYIGSLASPRVKSENIRKVQKPSASMQHELQKTRDRNQAIYKRYFDSLPFHLRD